MVILVTSLSLKPKEEAKAVAPLLWLAGAVVGEVASELGWKYVAKPAFKAIKDKLAKKIDSNPNNFDFIKGKPVKKTNGDIHIPISANDRLKIAKMLKDESLEIIEADTTRKAKVSNPVYDVDYVETDPFYNTGIRLTVEPYREWSQDFMAVDYFQRFYDIEFKPNAYKNKSWVHAVDSISGDRFALAYYSLDGVYGGTPYAEYKLKIKSENPYTAISAQYLEREHSFVMLAADGTVSLELYKIFLEQLNNANRTIYVHQGVFVPSDNTKIYDIDMNTPSSFVLDGFETHPYIIDMPDTYSFDSDEEISFEDLLNIYNFGDIETAIELFEDTNMLATPENNYNITYTNIVNNYFYENEEENEEVKEEIDIIIGEGDGGNNGGVPSTGGESPENTGLLATIKNYTVGMYEGVTSFFQIATDGFKSLTSGMTGFTTFLDDFFGWLPKEYVALLGAGFSLGVVSFFLRR